ncbi:MAG: CBS domain-containing protein [Hyphomicrobiales bacterium]
MFARDMIKDQGAVVTCRPEDTVQTAAVLLHSKFIGAMPVVDGDGKVVGMFGERDIVRAFASRAPNVSDMKVADLMAKNVISCGPEASCAEAMGLMKSNRIRHIPVVERGKLLGVISIRDTLEVLRQKSEFEANVMRDISIARAR